MKEKKYKIIHIIPTLDKGGAERLLVDLAKHIDKKRFAIEVLSLTTLGRWGFELKRAGVPVASLAKKRKGSLAALWRLYLELKRRKPDIIHLHLFGGDLYGLIAGRLAKVPYIVSTEHNLNYSESRFRRAIKKMLIPRMDKVVAVSEAVKGYLASEGIDGSAIEVIHNGIDTARFKSPADRGRRTGTIIGSVGRLTAQKDYATLLEAISLLKGHNVSCLLVGEGEERADLEKIIRKKGLASQVMLLGAQDAIGEFLAKLDIFVLPSRWEGFGLVVLEAGASRLPVIASKVDGIKEIITDNKNGLLFEAGNAGDLAEKIKELAADTQKAGRLAKELNANVLESFSIQKMAEKYAGLYAALQRKKAEFHNKQFFG